MPWGHYFCSRGAVSSFSSYCYGCCQLLLRLLGVFLLLVLVHLRFPLGVMRLAALLGFPCWLLFSEWQAVREALLFLLCPGSCRRFIGVRGVGSFFRTFGFQEVGAVSFRTLSGGCLSLHWQACGDLGCRGAAAGLLSALPRHSSCSIVPIPMPYSSHISITGAALEGVSLVLVAKDALELAPLPSPGFYSHLLVVL